MTGLQSRSRLAGEVLLGTVAIEPNRWGTLRPDRTPQIRLTEWTDRIAALGVDGIEVWEGHVTGLADAELAALLDGPAPVRILNSYVSFDEPEPTERDRAAAWADPTGAARVKFSERERPGDEHRPARVFRRRAPHVEQPRCGGDQVRGPLAVGA